MSHLGISSSDEFLDVIKCKTRKIQDFDWCFVTLSGASVGHRPLFSIHPCLVLLPLPQNVQWTWSLLRCMEKLESMEYAGIHRSVLPRNCKLRE